MRSSARQAEFCRQHPEIHADILQHFPNFDYSNPLGPREVVCDIRNPANHVGYQQWAFSCWHALESCGPLDLGIDLGSRKGITPYCVSVDLYGNGKPHPFYAGVSHFSDLVYDAAHVDIFPDGDVPFINSCHSLEHMPAVGDSGIIDLLVIWADLLRHNGVLALVIPDNDHFDVMACDRDHRHAWGAHDFRARVLDPFLARGGLTLVEYDTFQNYHSFNVVLRKS
jgi:hypothetical protein